MEPTPSEKNGRKQSLINMTLVAVVGQVGCITLVIVLAAVFGGLWLDSRFGTKPFATILLLVVSAPISLFLMFLIVRTALKKLKLDKPGTAGLKPTEEEVDRLGKY